MSFTYYIIKNEDLSGKLKNDGGMIDYVYGPEPSKYDDVICEQPLMSMITLYLRIYFWRKLHFSNL